MNKEEFRHLVSQSTLTTFTPTFPAGLRYLFAAVTIIAVSFIGNGPVVSANSVAKTIPAATDGESEREQLAAMAAEKETQMFRYIPTPKNVSREILGAGAAKPLFTGVDDVTVTAFLIDPADSTNVQAFTGAEVWGAAFDSTNNRVLFNNGSTLFEWPVGGTVNQLGTMVDGGGTAQAMVGLAWFNGQLYGIKNIAVEGVWAINTSTGLSVLQFTYPTTHDLGGFAIDQNTGTFYATDDSTATGARSLVRININGTITAIAPYPAGETDLDALAFNNGRAYIVPDQPGQGYVYDLIAGSYGPTYTLPWTTSEVFSGAAWIPAAVPGFATVSGRVASSSGQSVVNAVVMITDGASFSATVRSNSFGHFTFTDVPTGATYTVSGNAKGHTFTPLNVPVSADVSGLTLSSGSEQ